MRGFDVVKTYAPCLLAGCDHAQKNAAKIIALEIENTRNRVETERAHVAFLKAKNAVIYVAGMKADKAANIFAEQGTTEQANALVEAVRELWAEIQRLEMPPEK